MRKDRNRRRAIEGQNTTPTENSSYLRFVAQATDLGALDLNKNTVFFNLFDNTVDPLAFGKCRKTLGWCGSRQITRSQRHFDLVGVRIDTTIAKQALVRGGASNETKDLLQNTSLDQLVIFKPRLPVLDIL
jgi:hypothetical protein